MYGGSKKSGYMEWITRIDIIPLYEKLNKDLSLSLYEKNVYIYIYTYIHMHMKLRQWQLHRQIVSLLCCIFSCTASRISAMLSWEAREVHDLAPRDAQLVAEMWDV